MPNRGSTDINSLYDRKGLLDEVLGQFRLNKQGDHGPSHWSRVLHHARAIGEIAGANLLIVELFAFLHDSQRMDEYKDDLHGERAASYAASLNGRFFELGASDLDELTYAIRFHSEGQMHSNPTIQSCWDADRLDLGRVGIRPSARFLSPVAAQRIERAYRWSRLGDESTAF